MFIPNIEHLNGSSKTPYVSSPVNASNIEKLGSLPEINTNPKSQGNSTDSSLTLKKRPGFCRFWIEEIKQFLTFFFSWIFFFCKITKDPFEEDLPLRKPIASIKELDKQVVVGTEQPRPSESIERQKPQTLEAESRSAITQDQAIADKKEKTTRADEIVIEEITQPKPSQPIKKKKSKASKPASKSSETPHQVIPDRKEKTTHTKPMHTMLFRPIHPDGAPPTHEHASESNSATHAPEPIQHDEKNALKPILRRQSPPPSISHQRRVSFIGPKSPASKTSDKKDQKNRLDENYKKAESTYLRLAGLNKNSRLTKIAKLDRDLLSFYKKVTNSPADAKQISAALARLLAQKQSLSPIWKNLQKLKPEITSLNKAIEFIQEKPLDPTLIDVCLDLGAT